MCMAVANYNLFCPVMFISCITENSAVACSVNIVTFDLQMWMNALKEPMAVILMQLAPTLKGVTPALVMLDT